MRVLIPGLTAIRFIGEGEPNFRGKAHGRKYIPVKRGDILIVDEIVAIQHCRGTQYERVEGVDLDIASLFEVEKPRLDSLSDEKLIAMCKDRGIGIYFTDETTEVVEPKLTETIEEKGGDDISNTNEDEAAEVVELRMTKQNLDEFSDEELIAFAKSKNITGVTKRTSRRKIIPRILAFLPDE